MKLPMLKKNELETKKFITLDGYMKCAECGSNHFRYREELSIAGHGFDLYECMNCNSPLILDQDKKFNGKKAIYSQVLEYKQQKRLI